MDEPEQFIPENLSQPPRLRPLTPPQESNSLPLVVIGFALVCVIVVGLLFALNAPEYLSTFLLIVVALPIYFLPCLVAGSKHRNYLAIAIINVFLGWTLIGWVAALAWAVYREPGQR